LKVRRLFSGRTAVAVLNQKGRTKKGFFGGTHKEVI
jgi:hypothetical protein